MSYCFGKLLFLQEIVNKEMAKRGFIRANYTHTVRKFGVRIILH